MPVICGLSLRGYPGSPGAGSFPLEVEGLREQIRVATALGYDDIDIWAPGHEGSEVTIEQSLQLAAGVGLGTQTGD